MDNTRNPKNKRRAYRPTSPFAIVEGNGTDPFNMLSPEAAWILLKLYAKFNGFNRSNLSLTYRETKGAISERVHNRAIWQLLGFGFVDISRWGCLERNCTIYGFSNRWRQLSKPEAEPRRRKIESILAEIEKLKRERGGHEKRQRIAALRKSVFDA